MSSILSLIRKIKKPVVYGLLILLLKVYGLLICEALQWLTVSSEACPFRKNKQWLHCEQPEATCPHDNNGIITVPFVVHCRSWHHLLPDFPLQLPGLLFWHLFLKEQAYHRPQDCTLQ